MDRDLENLDADAIRPNHEVEEGQGAFWLAPPSSLGSRLAQGETVSFSQSKQVSDDNHKKLVEMLGIWKMRMKLRTSLRKKL